MAVTLTLNRSHKETVLARVQRDAEYAQALLSEAATLLLNGEPETARLILRDLVNATIGFASMDNLAAIFHAIRGRLKVNLEAHCVAA